MAYLPAAVRPKPDCACRRERCSDGVPGVSACAAKGIQPNGLPVTCPRDPPCISTSTAIASAAAWLTRQSTCSYLAMRGITFSGLSAASSFSSTSHASCRTCCLASASRSACKRGMTSLSHAWVTEYSHVALPYARCLLQALDSINTHHQRHNAVGVGLDGLRLLAHQQRQCLQRLLSNLEAGQGQTVGCMCLHVFTSLTRLVPTRTLKLLSVSKLLQRSTNSAKSSSDSDALPVSPCKTRKGGDRPRPKEVQCAQPFQLAAGWCGEVRMTHAPAALPGHAAAV